MAEQRHPLPPLVFFPPLDSASGGNDRDEVTGTIIPIEQEVFIDGKIRDGRYPARIDKEGYPLNLLPQKKAFGE
jgi:hypothetical protein